MLSKLAEPRAAKPHVACRNLKANLDKPGACPTHIDFRGRNQGDGKPSPLHPLRLSCSAGFPAVGNSAAGS